MLGTTFREVAGEDPEQLVQIRAQRAVGRLLDPEILEHRDALGACDPTRRGAEQALVDAAPLRVVRDRDVSQARRGRRRLR